MPLNPQYSEEAVNAEANALGALLNNGYLRIYDGEQPVNADTAITDQVLLAELRFANPTAFGAASGGVIVSNAIVADASANAAGEATWARCLKSNGTSVIMDGTVGLTDANIIINLTSITVGIGVSATPITIVIPKAGEILEA